MANSRLKFNKEIASCQQRMDALTVAQYIGWFVAIAFLLAIIVAICNFIYTAFLGASLGLNIKLKDYGPWAGN